MTDEERFQTFIDNILANAFVVDICSSAKQKADLDFALLCMLVSIHEDLKEIKEELKKDK